MPLFFLLYFVLELLILYLKPSSSASLSKYKPPEVVTLALAPFLWLLNIFFYKENNFFPPIEQYLPLKKTHVFHFVSFLLRTICVYFKNCISGGIIGKI